MKKHIAAIATIALVFTLLVPASCGGESPTLEPVESTSELIPGLVEPATETAEPIPESVSELESESEAVTIPDVNHEEAEASNRFTELLGLLPADLKDSHITVIDYASYRRDRNVSFSDPDEYIDWAMGDGVMGVASQQIFGGSFITGAGGGKLVFESTIRDEYLGYNLTDVTAEIQAGYPPNEFVAAIGSFSPQTTAEALSRQDEWSTEIIDSYTTKDYQGITIHSWGDGLKTHLTARMTPPHVDSLGRARPLAVTEQYLFYAAQTAGHVQVMIDASQDRWRSLADLPELALVADGMSTLNAYMAVMGYAEILGYEGMIGIIQEVDKPRLKKFTTFGSGLGEDEKGLYMAIVIIHENQDDAEENVSLLEERIKSTSSIWEPKAWNESIHDSDINAEGKVLLAKLYTTDSNLWALWVFSQDNLLLHE